MSTSIEPLQPGQTLVIFQPDEFVVRLRSGESIVRLQPGETVVKEECWKFNDFKR